MKEDLIYELGIPDDSREWELESRSDVNDLDVYETSGEEMTTTYLLTDSFERMLGYTQEDVVNWLDDNYGMNFQSLDIDSYDYGDGWIIFRREE